MGCQLLPGLLVVLTKIQCQSSGNREKNWFHNILRLTYILCAT